MTEPRKAAILLAVPLALLAAGCQRTGDPASGPSAAASAAGTPAPGAVAGLAVTDARLVLPAVGGRPGAAYFTVANGGAQGETLVSASVLGAREAQMHETSGGAMTPLHSVPVPAKGSVVFAPGGRHVMVFGLPRELHAGDKSELRLTFSDGKRVSVPLAVQAPGTGGKDDMASMHMSH